jgi:hypothetical protein
MPFASARNPAFSTRWRRATGYRNQFQRSGAGEERAQATANVRLSLADPLGSSEPISGCRKDAKECWHLPTDPAPNPRASAGLGVFYCQFKS